MANTNKEQLTKDRFLVCMGGNGSLVLESVIHMCALGVMNCDSVHVLMVELDLGNGNFSRTKELYQTYQALQDQLAHCDTDGYFVPKIHLYTWMPLNQSDKEHNTIQGMIKDDIEAEWISRLFFTQEEMKHEIDIGFKGHPNLGVLFMQDIIKRYDDTIAQYKSDTDRLRSEDVERFAYEFAESTEPRILFIGSCFGGTGAACLPSIKRLLSRRIKAQKAANANKTIQFGMLTMLPFFNVPHPVSSEEALAVDSENFQNKVKTVLNYYRKHELSVDPKSSLYQHVFLLGSSQRIDYPLNAPGRSMQRNPASFITWFACVAVEQFFTNPINENDDSSKDGIAVVPLNLPARTQLHIAWLEEGPMEWAQISHQVFPNLQARCAGIMQICMYYIAKMHNPLQQLKNSTSNGQASENQWSAVLHNILKDMSGLEKDGFYEGIKVFSKYVSAIVNWFFEIITHLPMNENLTLPEPGKPQPDELQEYLDFHRTDLKHLRKVLDDGAHNGTRIYFEHMLRSLVYQKFFNGYILCKMEQKRLEYWPDDEEDMGGQVDRSPMVDALVALWESNRALLDRPVINLLDEMTQTRYLRRGTSMEHITAYLLQEGINTQDHDRAVASLLAAMFRAVAFWRQ